VHHDYHHDDHHHDGHHDYHEPPPQHSYYKEHHDIRDSRDQYHDKDWYWTEEKDRQRDRSADEYKTESSRFADLHDRVQYLTHQLDMVFHDISVMKEIHEERHKELISWLSPVHDYAQATKITLDRMEAVVDAIRNDVETKEFKQHLEDLSTLIGHSHASLLEHLPTAMHNGKEVHLSFMSKLMPLSRPDARPALRLLPLHHHRFAGHASWKLHRVSPQAGHAAEEVLVRASEKM
jgi:hypothetical protein